MNENKNILKERDGFNSKWGFILACIGSAVGMGNIWRFPVMVSQYGGMTFLIPYFLFVILIASTGVIEEIALGRSAKAGPIGAFGYCSYLRWNNRKIGENFALLPVLGSLALAIGYTVVVGWIFKYTFLAFTGRLTEMGNNMDIIGGTFGQTATSFGNNGWLIVAMVIGFVIMAMGVADGIEKANKIMMPTLFILFIGLGIYIGTLEGAHHAYDYIFNVDLQKMKDPLLWIFAFGQAFFSLSIAGNGTVIYGSYLSNKEDIISASKNIALYDTIAALLATIVIVPAISVGGATLDVGGPGLMFIYLVNVFNSMPGGHIVGIIFYVCVLFAGISSLINLYETSVATLQEQFKMSRIFSVLVIGIIGTIIALCIQGIIEPWMDAVSIYACPLGAALAGIFFFWIGGKDYAENAVNEGAKKRIGSWFVMSGKYVYIPLTIIALVAGIVLNGIG
ncbi:sodium-dependent transporter [Fusobacterium sp.]|uniref:sodium-dependent transporter n=1 Tax=Fusobacterium sp. TaxID=68766 RepID=UPI000C70CB3C|nr:sodium-dependent transporter [Fusobacterium sp.]